MKNVLFTILILSLLLVACSSRVSMDSPTAVPTIEPTAVENVEAEPDYFQPRYEPLPSNECFISPEEDVEVTVDYDCGHIVVPEFYRGETTRELKVPFIRFNSGKGTTASPVVLHPGGPGDSHITELTFRVFNIMFDEVIPDHDVIFMDTRGSTYSDTFLDCPAIYSLGWQAYQQDLDQEAVEALFTETVQNCKNDYKTQGVSLEAYNSLELAGDVNSLRQALDYEKIIYFGTSYGSILGQHLMRDYPEILEMVILNGSSPLSRKSWIEDRALDIQTAFDNLVALCKSDEKCNAAYPDIPGLMDAAYAHFEDGPLPYTYTDPNDPSITIEGEVDASNLAGLINSLQGDKYGTFGIPATLASIAPPDQTEAAVDLLAEKSAYGIIASRNVTKGSQAFLMHFAVVCSDDMVRSADEIKLDDSSQFAIDAARNAAATYLDLCPLLDLKELPEGTDENVTVDIPTLLLSGSLDVATPPVHSQLIADALPNATHVIFPDHTHDQLGSLSRCVKGVFSQFIANPSKTLDTSCIETPDYTGFLLPDGSYSLVPSQVGAQNELPEGLTTQLDAFLQSQVYADGGNPKIAAPGLVLLVDTPDGRYLNAAGVANLEDGTPMEVNDHLQIGSNTKSMTIVLLMQLVEQGLLTLDDPLSKWLSEQAAILPNGDQITIRQMAQHTAGLWDYADGVIGGGLSDPAMLEKSYTPEELVQYAADNGTSYFAPGAEGQWRYSNTGYVLLGMIIEKITGEKLGDLMQERIFEPLGMKSAVLIEGVPQEGEITTHGYYWVGEERVDTTNWNASQGWAAGAAAMTAEDLATYAAALGASEFFQKPETLAQMLEFDPNAKSVGFPYGLGLGDFTGDGAFWGHAGQTLGFQSLWYTNPEKGIRVVGLSNSATYEAYTFLNVINMLEGDGALPISPVTLLPIGDSIPTLWVWKQFTNPSESTEIDETAGLILTIAKNQNVSVTTSCGAASGTYTVDGSGAINFELDASTLTCEADSLDAKFVQYLIDAARWNFANGDLIIELPADGGVLKFSWIG